MHIAILPLIGLLLIIGIAWYAIQQIPLPPMVKTVIIVVVCCLLILWVASIFGLMPGGVISVS